MRSVWGRLLFGMGVALSAVQDAYATVRDVRARDAGNGGSGGLGELQVWSAPPSVNAASTSTTLSRFEPPSVTQAVGPSTFSSVSAGMTLNPGR